MFKVKPETVEKLFTAQKRELQGRLRLDVSSHCSPTNPARPLDLRRAVIALGERVIRVLKDCAADAALLDGNMAGFQTNVMPPPPDNKRLRIMSSKDAFEGFVVYRLDMAMGLDSTSPDYGAAHKALAMDFHDWAQSQPDQARDHFGIEVEEPAAAFIGCEPVQPEVFSPLNSDA